MSLVMDSMGGYCVDLGGMCFREIEELGHLLVELGNTGKIDGKEFDLENLTAVFDSTKPEIFITDGIETTKNND